MSVSFRVTTVDDNVVTGQPVKKKKKKMEDDQNDTVGHYRTMAIVAFLRGKNLGGDYCLLHIRRRCIMLEK